jgi:lipopolysaccharide biosynthesis glycosyltransferase
LLANKTKLDTMEEKKNTDNPIVLVLAADQNYFEGLWVTLVSLFLCTNTSRHLKIYVFDGGIDNEGKDKLVSVLTKLNTNFSIRWIEPNISRFTGFLSMGGNYMAYSRLLIPNNIEDPKVIWLDVDLLVLKDIETLWEVEMGEKALAACLEAPHTLFRDDVNNLESFDIAKDAPYYNTGVLVMDNEKLIQEGFVEKNLDYLDAELGNYKFHDQSSINVICAGNIFTLDRSYNQLNTIGNGFKFDLEIAKANDCIYHFLQRPKPWQKYRRTVFSQIMYTIAHVSGLELRKLSSFKNLVERGKHRYPVLLHYISLAFGHLTRRSKYGAEIVNEQFANIKKENEQLNRHRDEVENILQLVVTKYLKKIGERG